MSDKTHQVVRRASTVDTPSAMHPMAKAILANNPTPETLRELMALQRDWQKDLARRAFTEALVALKADLPAFIKRDKTVHFQPQGKAAVHYKHASLAGAMDAITPALTAHGFSIGWIPKTGANLVTVTARLTHHAGHFEEAELSAPPDGSGMKSPAQAIASTITLLQRYSALALLGIATADMDEPTGEAAAPAAVNQRVDAQRNLKAMQYFIQQGRKREEIEKFVGKPVSEWTSQDLEKLRGWMQAPASKPLEAATKANAPTEDETGPSPLDYFCSGCKFTTDDLKAYEGHLKETGHDGAITTTKN